MFAYAKIVGACFFLHSGLPTGYLDLHLHAA